MTDDVRSRTDQLAEDEAEALQGFLDYHRETLRMKTAGLDAEQLARTHPPSTMTLGGMLKHLALVEDYWFSYIFAGNDEASVWQQVDWDADPDWEWHSAAADEPDALRALFDETASRCRDITSGQDMNAPSARPNKRTDRPFPLRWVMLHMIEEYARHNGHADLIRESIDGSVGE